MEELTEVVQEFPFDLTWMSQINPIIFVLVMCSLIAIVVLASDAVIHIVTKILDYCQTWANNLTINKSDRRFLK